MTVRELLESLHASLQRGAVSLDSPVRVEKWNINENSDFYPTFAAATNYHPPLLSIWCCDADDLDEFEDPEECSGLADDAPPLTPDEEERHAAIEYRAKEAVARFAAPPAP